MAAAEIDSTTAASGPTLEVDLRLQAQHVDLALDTNGLRSPSPAHVLRAVRKELT